MLAKMRCYFYEDVKLNQNMSSLLHGFMMENIRPEYSSKLHEMGLKPFSQSISYDEKGYFWEVCTTTNEAHEEIIKSLERVNEINLTHKDLKFSVSERVIKTISRDKMITEKLFQTSPNKFVGIEFVTPTAFKSQGNYVHMPSVRLIIQSLLMKLDASSSDYKYNTENVLEEIVELAEISNYRLRSNPFHIEGQVIPAFKGELTLKINGPVQMRSLIHMLVSFGEYSGVGIKTGLGMGKIEKKGSEIWTTKSTK